METFEGKCFSLIDSFGIITKVYKVIRKVSVEQMVCKAYLEEVEYFEEKVKNGIKRTYFFDEAEKYKDEGIQIVLLAFDDLHECVVIAVGILEDIRVRISKKPSIIEFSNLYDDFNDLLRNYYIDKYDKTQISSEIIAADCNLVIIDPKTKEQIQKEFIYDEIDKTWKAKIQIIPYKPYFAMRVQFEDDTMCQPVSSYEIGKDYYWGIHGLSKNNLQALKWLKKSNVSDAFYFIGRIFMEDKLLADKEEAYRYMLKAAKKNVIDAQYYLAKMYGNGSGCKQNINEAIKWFVLAAKQGHVDAQLELALKYYYGNQIDINYNKAFEWFLCAAENDNDEAKFHIGEMYFDGKGVTKDVKEAFKWFSESDDSAAQNKLGEMFLEGIGCKRSDLEAVNLFASAAMQGDEFGYFNLGRMYLCGYGVEIDYLKAKFLFEKAAEKGVGEAFVYLGNMYLEGTGVSKNRDTAIEMYQKAKKSGSISAIEKISSIENTKSNDLIKGRKKFEIQFFPFINSLLKGIKNSKK